MLKFWPFLTWLGFIVTILIAKGYYDRTMWCRDPVKNAINSRKGKRWFITSLLLLGITLSAIMVLVNQY